MTPAIIYAAKSTQDKHGSIPTQLDDCRELANRDGFEIVAEFKDESFSAFKGNRGPGLAAAQRKAEEMAPCVLIVQHTDRLSRGDGIQAQHLGEIFFWANRNGVTIRSCQDDFLAEPRMGALMAAVAGMRNHEDSARKSKSVAAGARRRAEKGLFPGGRRVKYGYRRRDKDEPPEIVDAEAAVVRRMYELADGGASRREIASRLRVEGVRTPEGNHWCPQNVGRLLRDPTYKGCITIKGEVVYEGGAWTIVDVELWDRVNLATKARTSSTSRGAGRGTNGRHLLVGGLLRCSCGAAMGSRRDTRHGHEYYLCRSRNELKPGTPGRCEQPYVQRELVDGALIDYFTRIGLDVETTRSDYLARTEHELVAARALRGEAEREQMRIQERLDRVKRDYLDGQLDAATWTELKAELAEQAAAATASPDRQLDREAELTLASEIRDLEADLLERLAQLRAAVVGEVRDAETVDAVRCALTRLFESFTLMPQPAGVPLHKLLALAQREDGGRAVLAGMLGAELADVEAIGGTVDQVAAIDAGGYVLIPQIRREALAGLAPGFEPVLHREPMGLDARLQTIARTGSNWLDCLLAPIEVPA